MRSLGRSQGSEAEKPYVYTEYTSGLHDVLAKAADYQCGGDGSIEEDLKRSEDVHHGVTAILGGGIENDYLGLAGAVAAICSRRMAMKRLGVPEGQKKPAPKRPQARQGES